MNSIWLFIDENGYERATDLCKPCRTKNGIYNFSHRPEHWLKNNLYLEFANEWYTTIAATDYGIDGWEFINDSIILPNGTIKKLTNKDLTFDDEPIEYNG